MKRTYLTLLFTVMLGVTAAVFFPYNSVTPGVLIDGHAALKNDCFSCHTIGKGAVTDKCRTCHQSDGIGKMTSAGIPLPKERTKSVLIHSSVKTMECYYCHTEHNGRSRNQRLQHSHIQYWMNRSDLNALSAIPHRLRISIHFHPLPAQRAIPPMIGKAERSTMRFSDRMCSGAPIATPRIFPAMNFTGV
jgi:hypothetical protein